MVFGRREMKLKGTHSLIAYPPILMASFYATWLAGRFHLGYWPRSSLDDPKYIEGFWMCTYDVTAILLLVGLPLVGVLAAIRATSASPTHERKLDKGQRARRARS